MGLWLHGIVKPATATMDHAMLPFLAVIPCDRCSEFRHQKACVEIEKRNPWLGSLMLHPCSMVGGRSFLLADDVRDWRGGTWGRALLNAQEPDRQPLAQQAREDWRIKVNVPRSRPLNFLRSYWYFAAAEGQQAPPPPRKSDIWYEIVHTVRECRRSFFFFFFPLCVSCRRTLALVRSVSANKDGPPPNSFIVGRPVIVDEIPCTKSSRRNLGK
jgi:hypothetical protein